MKPIQLQRYRKDRSKGVIDLSEHENYARVSEAFRAQPLQDLWSFYDLDNTFIPGENTEGFECNPAKAALAGALQKLGQSQSARLMIREAKKQGWRMGLSALGGNDFHLNIPDRIMTLDNAGLNAEVLLRNERVQRSLEISLIRALRDAWQEKRHGGFEEYSSESILMLERVRAADCDVLTILIAWELRAEGQGELWRQLLALPEADMATAFSEALERDPKAVINGKALAAAFRQWYYSDDRINACDHETLEYLDEILSARLEGAEMGQRKLKPVNVEMLSCLPDKTAYLQGFGYSIMTDPIYAGMKDFINQSHMLQIMREQSAVMVQGVPFRNAALAEMIFPNGQMTPDFTSEDRDL